MRDRVNVSIDHRLKQMFEDLMPVHGREWNEVFEECVLDFLVKIDPVQALEYKQKIEEEKLELLRHSLARTRMNIAVLQSSKEKDQELAKQKEVQLQKERVELFEKEFEIVEKQWKRGTINWVRYIDLGRFNDKIECKKWFERELKARGLMEKYHHYD